MRKPILIAIIVMCASVMVVWNLQPVKQEVAANQPAAADAPPIVVSEVIEPNSAVTVTQKISATIPEDAPKAEPQKKNPFRLKQKTDEDNSAKPEPLQQPKPVREAETPVPVAQIVAKKARVLHSDYEANEALIAGEKLHIAEKHEEAETQLLSALEYWKKQADPNYSKLADTAYWLGRNQYQGGAGNPLVGANWLRQSLDYEEMIAPARPAIFRKGFTQYTLGNCYRDLQSYKKAEDCYLAAKSTFEAGGNFVGVVDSFDCMRYLYTKMGQASRVQICTDEIRRLIPEKLYNNNYYQRRLRKIEYDECLRDKKYSQAEEFLDQIKGIDVVNAKSRLSDRASLAEDYASLYFAMNKPEVGLTYSETASRLWESHYIDDPENTTLGAKYYNFGRILIEHKKYERGHGYLLRALKIWKKEYCSCHV